MRRTLGQILGRGAVEGWQPIAIQRIPHAIPRQWPGDVAGMLGGDRAPRLPETLGPGIHVAGDHLEDSSINGAMRSGRLAAEACLAR